MLLLTNLKFTKYKILQKKLLEPLSYYIFKKCKRGVGATAVGAWSHVRAVAHSNGERVVRVKAADRDREPAGALKATRSTFVVI